MNDINLYFDYTIFGNSSKILYLNSSFYINKKTTNNQ